MAFKLGLFGVVLLAGAMGFVSASPPASQDPSRQEPVVVRENLLWTAQDNGLELDWEEADRFCRELLWGGREDWELPTEAQLKALFAPGRTAGIRALETAGSVNRYPIHMDAPFRPTHLWYWTRHVVASGRARNVDFFTGLVGTFAIGYRRASGALCVCLQERTR